MKALLIALCLMLTSCNTLTVMCVEQSQAQYNTAVKVYGKENVQLWRLKNANPIPYAYHMQARVKIDGQWYWIPNRPYTEIFSRDPQPGCTLHKQIR